jgi:hypothetical protein
MDRIFCRVVGPNLDAFASFARRAARYSIESEAGEMPDTP